jgi:hypothetical protein
MGTKRRRHPRITKMLMMAESAKPGRIVEVLEWASRSAVEALWTGVTVGASSVAMGRGVAAAREKRRNAARGVAMVVYRCGGSGSGVFWRGGEMRPAKSGVVYEMRELK